MIDYVLKVYGPEISLHFTDPYTLLHFEVRDVSFELNRALEIL